MAKAAALTFVWLICHCVSLYNFVWEEPNSHLWVRWCLTMVLWPAWIVAHHLLTSQLASVDSYEKLRLVGDSICNPTMISSPIWNLGKYMPICAVQWKSPQASVIALVGTPCQWLCKRMREWLTCLIVPCSYIQEIIFITQTRRSTKTKDWKSRCLPLWQNIRYSMTPMLMNSEYK
jgi:hypothetical protein